MKLTIDFHTTEIDKAKFLDIDTKMFLSEDFAVKNQSRISAFMLSQCKAPENVIIGKATTALQSVLREIFQECNIKPEGLFAERDEKSFE